MRRYFVILLLLLVHTSMYLSPATYAQKVPTTPTVFFEDLNLRMDRIEYIVNWNSFDIETTIHISWVPDTISPYTNHYQSLEFAQSMFSQIFSRVAQNIFVDAQNSLLDFADAHSAYRLVLTNILNYSTLQSHIPDKNLQGSTVIYRIPMSGLIGNYIMPSFVKKKPPYFPSTEKDETAYTSIIIALESPIKIVGSDTAKNDTNALSEMLYDPKIIPRIYAKDAHTLLYTPEYFSFNKYPQSRPFAYIYEEDYSLVDTGSTPLYIIPIALNSRVHGDLLLSDDDANKLLTSDITKQLMEEGKVFFIIPPPTTRKFK